MNSHDLKVLLEETKKQTARNIIKVLNKMVCEGVNRREELFNRFEDPKYATVPLQQITNSITHVEGYLGALNDAIKNIEDDYHVGPRYINENPNVEGAAEETNLE